MRTIEHIDGWIVGRFEAFSHWSQRTFGADSVLWYRLVRGIEVAFLAANIYTRSGVLKYLWWWIIITCVVDAVTEDLKHYGDGSLANRRKHHVFWQMGRTISLCLIAGMLYGDIKALNLWFEFALVADYFGAVEDLPPGLSRVRQWLNSLSTQQTPVPVEN